MTSVYSVLCLIIVVISALFIVSRVSRHAGKAEAEAEMKDEAAEDREKYHRANPRPLARGSELVRRMRDWSRR